MESQERDYLTDLTTLAGMDSYSFDRDDVNRVVDWLEQRLHALQFAVVRYPQAKAGDNLRADRMGSGSGRVLLLGHTDTVFPRGKSTCREFDAVLTLEVIQSDSRISSVIIGDIYPRIVSVFKQRQLLFTHSQTPG